MRSTALLLERSDVTGCLDVKERPSDALFQTAFERSLMALQPAKRRGR